MGDFPWQKGPGRGRERWRSSRMPWQRDDDAHAPHDVPHAESPDPVPERVPTEFGPDPRAVPEPDPTAREPEPEPVSPAPATSTRAAKPSQAAAPPRPASRGGTSKSGPRIGGILVLALVGCAVVVGLVNANGGDDAPADEMTADEEREKSDEIADTVLGFFDGVVAQDAAQALAYVDPAELEADSAALLTDEMLVASQRRAPIEDVSVTNIEIDPDHWFHATAEASYRLGGEQTTTPIDLWQNGSSDTGWTVRLDDRALSFSGSSFEGLQPVVYGADVELDVRTPLFPGAYEIGFADAPHLSLVEMAGIEAGTSIDGGSDVAVLTHPLGRDSYVELGVSPAGREAYVDAVMDDIDACLAATRAESRCAQAGGSAGDDGARDGTVQRRLDEEVSDLDLEPRPLLDDPMRLRDIVLIAARYDATCAGGEKCSGVEFFDYPVVEFGSGSPRVTWEPADSSSS